jgi:hypothetical protein
MRGKMDGGEVLFRKDGVAVKKQRQAPPNGGFGQAAGVCNRPSRGQILGMKIAFRSVLAIRFVGKAKSVGLMSGGIS